MTITATMQPCPMCGGEVVGIVDVRIMGDSSARTRTLACIGDLGGDLCGWPIDDDHPVLVVNGPFSGHTISAAVLRGLLVVEGSMAQSIALDSLAARVRRLFRKGNA